MEITDSSSTQVFRIKAEKNIKIKLKGSTNIQKTYVKKFLSDSSVILARIGTVSLSDIDYISFKSDKGARTVRQIFYPAYLITITSYFAAYGEQIYANDIVLVTFSTFFVTSAVSAGIETVAGVVFLVNKRKEFERVNMKLRIYR